MTGPDLSAATCLLLNAGQLAFHNAETRAIALALACLTDQQESNGATGTGTMPEIEALIELAQEMVTVDLDISTVLHVLDCLVVNRYLAAPHYGFRMPYRIDTTTLPMRVTSDDCGEPNYSLGVESDVFGYGDH